jgi:hypothetical protein
VYERASGSEPVLRTRERDGCISKSFDHEVGQLVRYAHPCSSPPLWRSWRSGRRGGEVQEELRAAEQ